MVNNKRYLSIGPGGMKCPCCGPRPGKVKQAVLRAAKRGPEAEATRNEIDAGLEEYHTTPSRAQIAASIVGAIRNGNHRYFRAVYFC